MNAARKHRMFLEHAVCVCALMPPRVGFACRSLVVPEGVWPSHGATARHSTSCMGGHRCASGKAGMAREKISNCQGIFHMVL
jgi:hypothetical protein